MVRPIPGLVALSIHMYKCVINSSSQCRRLVQKRPSICYYVYVIMHVKDPQLSVVRVGHCVPLAGFCLCLYDLHALNRDVNMIQSIQSIHHTRLFSLSAFRHNTIKDIEGIESALTQNASCNVEFPHKAGHQMVPFSGLRYIFFLQDSQFFTCMTGKVLKQERMLCLTYLLTS